MVLNEENKKQLMKMKMVFKKPCVCKNIMVLPVWGSNQENVTGHLTVLQESSHIFCLSVHIDSSVRLSDQR